MKKAMPAAVAAAVMNELPILIGRSDSGSCLLYAKGRKESIRQTPVSFLDDMCRKNFSTMEGRLQAAGELLGIHQKVILLVSERSGEIYFPTLGLNNTDCQWLLYSAIVSYHSCKDGKTEILFSHGEMVVMDVAYRTVRMQMGRCQKLCRLLNE